MIGFIAAYSHNLELQAIRRHHLSTHLPLHRCTRTRILSSLVVSCQRIYYSLTVTSNHTYSRRATISSLSYHISAAANSEDSTRLLSTTLDYYCIRLLLLLLLLSCRTLLITTLHGLNKNTVFCCPECLCTAPLPSNRRSTVPRVCSCGNVFTD
jgi:hypothetical protein